MALSGTEALIHWALWLEAMRWLRNDDDQAVVEEWTAVAAEEGVGHWRSCVVDGVDGGPVVAGDSMRGQPMKMIHLLVEAAQDTEGWEYTIGSDMGKGRLEDQLAKNLQWTRDSKTEVLGWALFH